MRTPRELSVVAHGDAIYREWGCGRRGLRLGVGWALGEALHFGVEAKWSGSTSVLAEHGVRPMTVESGWSVLRAANPGRPGMDVPRANETMMRAVVVLVGRAVRGARCACPSLPLRRMEATEVAFGGLSPDAGVR